MQCEYCGRALKPGEWQCPGCGAPVEEKKEENKPEEEQNQQTNAGSTNDQNQQTGVPNYNRYYEQYNQSQEQAMPLHISAYGGFWARLIAEWIDLCVCCLVLGIADAALNMDGEFLLVVYGLYRVIGDSSIMGGATLGRRAMGLKVVNSDFETISVMQSIIRNIGKLVSYITMFVGYLMIMFTNKKQGLHDRIANTYVIKVRR